MQVLLVVKTLDNETAFAEQGLSVEGGLVEEPDVVERALGPVELRRPLGLRWGSLVSCLNHFGMLALPSAMASIRYLLFLFSLVQITTCLLDVFS